MADKLKRYMYDMSSAARQRLDQLAQDLKERAQSFLGYPIATDFDYSEIQPLFNHFLNNIGDPTAPSLCLLNTNDMEREVIEFYMSLLNISRDDSWGYITSGSTEGNLYGLLVARERFPEGVVYYSEASHYSVLKNAILLRIPTVAIKTQQSGEIDYGDLAKRLAENKAKPAIVIANIGTTMTEAKDDISKVCRRLVEANIKDYHIHCDAALVGSYGSFMYPKKPFDFADGADSMTISAYKFLGIPEPCGVVLTKRSLRVSPGGKVSYIGSVDSTISGSRSGHTALMIWYRLQQLGKGGICERYLGSLEVAKYAQRALEGMGWQAWRNPGALTVVLKTPPRDLVRKWQLATDGDCSHIICMPGVTTERVDRFIADLENVRQVSR